MRKGLLQRIFNAIATIKKREQQKKYDFVFKLGYRYFYDIQEPYKADNTLDIPEFMYEFRRRNIAAQKTIRQMKKILEKNLLNYCFKSAKKFAKLHKISV